MVQSLSLHGAKAQTLARINQNEKEIVVPQTQIDAKFSSQIKGEGLRAPIHQDFTSFLASSSSHLQENFLIATEVTATMQNQRFGPENAPLQKTTSNHHAKQPEIKLESILPLDKIGRIPPTDTPKLIEVLSSAPSIQPQKYTIDKGYGPRTTIDPLILSTSANPTDIEQISMGLVGAVHERSQHQDNNKESNSQKFGEANQKLTKSSIKVSPTAQNENAQLLKKEEIEALRDVKEKFKQQLNAQHPYIMIPLKHPEGIVDIHMRFDRKEANPNDANKGKIRVMFTGSNDQIVALFAQHREEFMNIITQEGYTIDSSRMQFNKCTSLTKSTTM